MPRLTPEQLNASKNHEWEFDEEEVEIPQLGGSVLLRELTVKRQGVLLSGLQDEHGNIKDIVKMQVRLFAAGCVEPRMKESEVEKFLPSWPTTEAKRVFDVINKLGGPEFEAEKEAEAAEAEFPESE